MPETQHACECGAFFSSMAALGGHRAAMGHRPPCGTHNGYVAHTRRAEIPCEACREAHRVWTEVYREANPEVVERNAARTSARSRAMEALARLHRREFEELFALALEDMGMN